VTTPGDAQINEGPEAATQDGPAQVTPTEHVETVGRWRRLLAWGRDLRPAWKGLAAFLLYLAASIAFWVAPMASEFTTRYVGLGATDAKLYQWSLEWTPYALRNGIGPFFTHQIFAPNGVGLTWVTFMPGLGVVLWPITRTFGSLVSYNVALLLAPALAGWAAYLVCHRITRRFWPSMLGGYIFGFSAFMIGHMHGHLNLVMVFPAPLAVYLVIRWFEGSIGAVRFVALFTLTQLFFFSITTELFATTAVFGVVAFVFALVAGRDRWRRLLETGLLAGLGYLLVAAILFVPYLIPAMKNAPQGALRPPEGASLDLFSFVVPHSGLLIGGPQYSWFTGRYVASGTEDAGYLGIALILMLVGFAISERRRRGTWALLAFALLLSVLALGPLLHIRGEPSITLPPGKVMASLPLVQHATPQRFPAYTALVVGVVAAIWLARARGRFAWVRWVVVLVGAVMLMPRVPSPPFHPFETLPSFFKDGGYRAVIQPGEIVFPIVWRTGEEMLYQASTDFDFVMPYGYVGPVPAEYGGQPLYRGLAIIQNNPYVPQPAVFASWLEEHEVDAVVLADTARDRFGFLLESVGLQPVYEGGGVSVWRLPPGRGYTPVDEAKVTYGGHLDRVGGTLGGFSLPNLDGTKRIDGQALEGRPKLFTFFAPNCDACPDNLRVIEQIHRAHPELATIGVESWDPTGEVATLPADVGVTFPIGVDPLGRLATAFTASEIPFTVLVGADGTIVARWTVPFTQLTLPRFEKALAGET
jgi:Uncharacterized membrane protein, required for N-linked glycosylation